MLISRMFNTYSAFFGHIFKQHHHHHHHIQSLDVYYVIINLLQYNFLVSKNNSTIAVAVNKFYYISCKSCIDTKTLR